MLHAAVVVGGTGAAGFAAQRAGVLDDGLRAAGIRPHAEPDPHDVALLAEAAAGQAELLAALGTAGRGEDPTAVAELRAVLREQLAAVSDDPSAAPIEGNAIAAAIPSAKRT